MKNYIKMSNERLLAYSHIKAKISMDKSELAEIMKFSGNAPLLYTDSVSALEREIAKNSRELKRLKDAVQSVKNEVYGKIICDYYVKNYSIEKIAENLCCDVSTVKRHKKFLLKKIAVRFYGVNVFTNLIC